MSDKLSSIIGAMAIIFWIAGMCGAYDSPAQKQHNKLLREDTSYRADFCRTTTKDFNEMRLCMWRY